MSNTIEASPLSLPLFVTPKLAQTRAFYVDKLGWEPAHDMPGYLHVRSGQASLAFMTPESGPGPEEMPSFPGRGVLVSVPVEDADRHCQRARTQGLEPRSEPTLKPWGWRSYLLEDPNGVLLDFFHVQ